MIGLFCAYVAYSTYFHLKLFITNFTTKHARKSSMGKIVWRSYFAVARSNINANKIFACTMPQILILSLQHSFFKQFYAAVTKADYITLRLGFIEVKVLKQHIIQLSSCWKAWNLLILSMIDTLQEQSQVQFSQVHDTSSWRWLQASCGHKVCCICK